MFVWLNRCPQVAGICLEKMSDFNSFSGLYGHLPRPPTPLLKINYPKKTACFCVMFVWLSLCPHVAGNCLERGDISKFSSDSGGKPPQTPLWNISQLPQLCKFNTTASTPSSHFSSYTPSTLPSLPTLPRSSNVILYHCKCIDKLWNRRTRSGGRATRLQGKVGMTWHGHGFYFRWWE